MLIAQLLADSVPGGFEQLMNLGAAGMMGAMWLWERHTSRQREEQIDEAHTRIISDRVQLGELMDVVRQNTEAITRLTQLSAFQHGRTSNTSPDNFLEK